MNNQEMKLRNNFISNNIKKNKTSRNQLKWARLVHWKVRNIDRKIKYQNKLRHTCSQIVKLNIYYQDGNFFQLIYKSNSVPVTSSLCPTEKLKSKSVEFLLPHSLAVKADLALTTSKMNHSKQNSLIWHVQSTRGEINI